MSTPSICTLLKYFNNDAKSISRGENHYKSGHVQHFSMLDGVYSGKVAASMKKKVYKVKILLNNLHEISTSSCECPRGNYKCSHAAALYIFAINNVSSTDLECTWTKPKVRVEELKTASQLFPDEEYNALKRSPTEEDRSWLLAELKAKAPFTGFCWLMSPEPQQTTFDLPLIEDLLAKDEFKKAIDKKAFFRASWQLESLDKICEIAVKTTGQRSNELWHLTRKGRLTASNFGLVINAKKHSSILARRILNNSTPQVQSILWGNSHEAEAISLFISKINLPVTQTGIWLEEYGCLGASPDGLVASNAILEVKCPFSWRDSTIDQCLADKKFYLQSDEAGNIHLKKIIFIGTKCKVSCT